MLYRTGPGGYQITTDGKKTFSMSHWFDGFAQTHRFELAPPASGGAITRVVYNSRYTCDKRLEKIQETGTVSSITFGQKHDPCSALFKKVMSSFKATAQQKTDEVSDVNVGVTIHHNMPGHLSNRSSKQRDPRPGIPSIDNLWLKTDTWTLQEIDPLTLEPLAAVNQQKFHSDLQGRQSGAHPSIDPLTGDLYNYNLELGREAVYRVFCVSAKTGKTTILETLRGLRGAYIHSFFLTQRYVIICLFNAFYTKGGLGILSTMNIVDAIEFDPNIKNKWLVIDRLHSRGLVSIYESDPFFAFHCINAWDKESSTTPGKSDIIVELPVYENLDILKRLYYENVKGTSPAAINYIGEKGATSRPALTRWKLPNVSSSTTVSPTDPATPAERIFAAPKLDSMELPTYNPLYATKPSRFIYGVCERGNASFFDGLLKFDTLTQTAKARVVHAQSPGEPIFVPDPQGTEEDEGVLLSVVLDGMRGTSYLLVLDARTFEEVGRADLEVAVPFGFHGTHVALS